MILIGLALVGLGLFLMARGSALLLILFGPGLVAVGGVVAVRGLLPGRVHSFGCAVLLGGLFLLAVATVPLMLLLTGIMEDNESTGMLVTILLFFVGVPALLVLLFGLLLRAYERL